MKLSLGETTIVVTELTEAAVKHEKLADEYEDHADRLTVELATLYASVKHHTFRASVLRRTAERLLWEAEHRKKQHNGP